MVAALLDTSVIVDLLRGYPPAGSWFVEQDDLGVPRVVWLEVIEGAQNKQALQDALNLLRRFELVELTLEDTIWATEKLISLTLSHNVDSFDCLIAAASHRLQLPLFTRNIKHFAPLLGELAEIPY